LIKYLPNDLVSLLHFVYASQDKDAKDILPTVEVAAVTVWPNNGRCTACVDTGRYLLL